jgi:hypothetical protein
MRIIDEVYPTLGVIISVDGAIPQMIPADNEIVPDHSSTGGRK